MGPGNRIHRARQTAISLQKSYLHLSITSRVEPDITESCLCILTRIIWCFQVSARVTCPHRTRRENLNILVPLRTGPQTLTRRKGISTWLCDSFPVRYINPVRQPVTEHGGEAINTLFGVRKVPFSNLGTRTSYHLLTLPQFHQENKHWDST
jgi:hypothetical protein